MRRDLDENQPTASSEPNAVTPPEAPERPESDEKASDGESAKRAAGAAPESTQSWRDRSFIIWVAAIVAILCVELYAYGHNGRVQVCVGIDGYTNFELLSQPRSAENFRVYPQCAERSNLGLWSNSQDVAQATLNDACTRATRISGADAKQACLRRDKKWTRRVMKEHIWPWDSRLYRRLLWLD